MKAEHADYWSASGWRAALCSMGSRNSDKLILGQVNHISLLPMPDHSTYGAIISKDIDTQAALPYNQSSPVVISRLQSARQQTC